MLAAREVHDMLYNEDYEKFSVLLAQGLNLETKYEMWCHSSHGLQTHTLLSYCGELDGMHCGSGYDRHDVENEHPLAACQWVRALLELGARVETVPVAATLYRCHKCLELVLLYGADINGKMHFEGGPVPQSGFQRCLGWQALEPLHIFIKHQAVDFVPGMLGNARGSNATKFSEYLAFELPLRQDNCCNAICTFLAAAKYCFRHLIDRNVAAEIAEMVWASRTSNIWSFHKYMLLTDWGEL